MTNLTKLHTPLERLRHRAGSFGLQAMHSTLFAMGPASILNVSMENAVSGCLRGLGIQTNLYVLSYSCEVEVLSA
jgi:hypothetical protein